MDKQLRYNIDIRLNDGASQGTEALNSRLAKLSSWTKAINAETQKLGTQFSTVSKSASNIFAQTNLSASQLRQNFQQISNTSTTAAAGMNQVANVAPRFNALNVSVQQVARELPSLAISANTFFLAISNNLPILADSISAARKENEAMIASGQKATPVWKQVASSLFSWQTALVLGVTALSMYSGEIIDCVSDLLNFDDGLNQTKKSMEAVRALTIDYNKSLLEEVNNLRYAYDAILQTTEGTAARKNAINQLNEAYGEYMPYLLSEKSSLEELKTIYDLVNTSLSNQIALKTKRAQIDKILEESAEKQSESIEKLQEALADQRIKESLSDDIITSLVNDAPKWREAGDTLGEAFQQAVKNIQAEYPTIVFNSDLRKGIYQYIESFYEMESSVDAVNKRIDLLLGKTDQIKELGVLVVTPEKKEDTNQDLNKNLATIGGITNKINELKEAQSKASGQQQIDLEKEIQLWQEKLNLTQRAIAQGAIGNLGNSQYKDLIQSELKSVSVPEPVKIPVEFDQNTLKRSFRIMQVQFSDSIKELEITGKQIGGILTGSIQSFAQNFGQALASGDGIEVFKSLLISVMDMLQQFGAALIAAGVATEAFKSLFANPIAGIIAGTALIATAAAAKAALQNATAFADGGIVSGPTYALVGEYSGASNNPEVIAPLNKLKSMIEPAQSDSGMSGEVRFVIKGETLEGILSKMNRKRNRTR
jgi:hypothetical protein